MFFSALSFHPDPKDPDPAGSGDVIAFGMTVSAILMTLAVDTVALLNAVLRLANKDIGRRAFWAWTAALCVAGATVCYVLNYLF